MSELQFEGKRLPVDLEKGDDGKIRLPAVVENHLNAGYSVIPIGLDKRPLDDWKELQERQPTGEEVRHWIKTRYYDIAGWARITGKHSGIIVLDDDTKDGRWFREWGLQPHVRTGSGGLHWIGRHPCWHVKTLNSKSGKEHFERYPYLDVRGDGGYSLISGFHHRGGYTWLRSPDDIDELDVLPQEARAFFGLLEAPKEKVRCETERSPRMPGEAPEGLPTPQYLVKRALEEAEVSGRNNGGAWLVQQLRDHLYSEEEILEIGAEYVAQCGDVNTKGKPEPYTIQHFQRTVRSIMSRPAREPWGTTEEVTITTLDALAEGLAKASSPASEETLEETLEKDEEAPLTGLDIDLFFVPTEVGATRKYPPWAIEGFVRQGSRGVLYGVSGAAKSYVAVDLVRAAMTGGTWLGRKVQTGSVVYVAAEDYLGIHHRTEVTVRFAGVTRQHRARVFERAVAMTNHEDVKLLLRAMDLLPEKPAFFIIDNLSLCMGDGDPNEGIDAKRFVDGCQAIQDYKWRTSSTLKSIRDTDKVPITVVIIHHTNKQGGFNGSQYFENFVDSMSEVVWDKKGTIRTVFSRKQRHGERHEPLAFELREVEPIDHLCIVQSLVLPPASTDTERAFRKLVPPEMKILECLQLADLERALGQEDKPNLLEGLSRGEIAIRSGVATGSLGRYLNALRSGGSIEPVIYEDEKGKLKKLYPERFRLTSEGRRVIASRAQSELLAPDDQVR